MAKDTKATIPVAGVQTKFADLIGTYQACLDSRATLSTQRAAIKETLATRTAAETKRRTADRALKPWVVQTYGASSQEAHDFGFPPPKAPTRSLEEKTDAAALAAATREARHTMGSKQKEKVKGTISAPTAPAAPATTVQATTPAASTTNTTTNATPTGAAPSPVTNGATPSPQH